MYYKSVVNPRRACAARVTVVAVCLSVCLSVGLSVKSHLTSVVSVRPETSATYSAGNECQKSCGVFSETVSFQSYGTSLYGYSAVVTAEYPRALQKCDP